MSKNQNSPVPPNDRKSKRVTKRQRRFRISPEEHRRRTDLEIDLHLDTSLPIEAARESIVQSIQEHPVIIVCGETGSGKSTQLPKFCWAAGLGRTGWIGHTQPRRLAARSIASRLANELGDAVGNLVGYKMRFTDRVGESTIFKLMTDGILLSEMQHSRSLDGYDCVIIDEAHERSINIDWTLAQLKKVIAKRPSFRVIITSATIDAEKFADYFASERGPAPIFYVSGRTYPVEIRYRPYADDANALEHSFDELLSEPIGDILLFLPTEREIRFSEKQIKGFLTARGLLERYDVLPLFARMPESDQNRIFNPSGKPRVILATNVAESSITVPRVRYVIDSGFARISRFAPRSNVQRLPIEPISQASANQRSGRCGRVADGICIRLFSEEDFQSRSQFTTPEIRRANLTHVMLQVKSAGYNSLESLDWLEEPLPESIREAKSTLHELNAIDENEQLTSLGRKLGKWPVDPRVARILLAANENQCLADCLIIASGLEVQDPRLRPAEKQNAADEAQAIFQHPASDFGSILLLWDFYHDQKSKLSRSKLEKALQQRFLSPARFREWIDVHNQLKRMTELHKMSIGPRRWIPDTSLKTLAVEPNTKRPSRDGKGKEPVAPANPVKEYVASLLRDPNYQAIHLSMLTGLLSGIAMRREDGKYWAANRLETQLWPGSGVRSCEPRWIVATELVETTQRYARNIAAIEPYWLADLAGHLIRYTYDSPHFSSKLGQAMIHRKSSLFGLPALPADRVTLAPLDPIAARKLLIDEGIVGGNLKTRARFVSENAKVLEELEEFAHRSRRQSLMLDRFQLEAFYHQRIPVDVVDRNSLERWDRTLVQDSKQANSPYLRDSEFLQNLNRDEIINAYPDSMRVGGANVPVAYQFAPGTQNDGVTAFVPESAIAQISEDRIGWLVPGLLRDRILGLIKSLPKRLRRNLSPAPDFADKICNRMLSIDTESAGFWSTLCSIASEFSGEKIQRSDFDPEKLDDYLKLQIAVVDASGKVAKVTRKLSEVCVQNQAAQHAFDPAKSEDLKNAPWLQRGLQTFTIDSLPESVQFNHAGSQITRYPTLKANANSVDVVLVDHPQAADACLRLGLIELFCIAFHRELQNQVRYLPGLKEAKLNLGRRIASQELEYGLSMLLVHNALLLKQPLLRNRDDFETRKIKAFEKISMAAVDVGKWLPKLAESYHKVSLLLETTKLPPLQQSDIQSQLDWMFQQKFLQSHDWILLNEFPRYLQAIEHRIRKLGSRGLPADTKAMELLKDYQGFLVRVLNELGVLVAADQPLLAYEGRLLGDLAEYAFMLQEFRVSLFAQQLGTVLSVSTKRLDKQIEKIESR